MIPTASEFRVCNLPASTSPFTPDGTAVADPAEEALVAALRRINVLPAERRYEAVFDVLAAYVDQKASTSPSPSAIPFASGFRTMHRSIQQMHDVSVQTAQTLGTFLGAWLQALMEHGVAVNAPVITHEQSGEGTAICLAWKRGDRTLEATFLGQSASYTATSFTPDRRLDYQEGDLDLSVPAIHRTVGWVVGHPAD